MCTRPVIPRAVLRGAFLLLLLVSVPIAGAGAQQRLFVPAASQNDPLEANTFSNYPFMRAAGIWQAMIGRFEVGTTSAVLNEVAFRFDGPSFGSKGGTVRTLEIWIGDKGVDPTRASPLFAANHAGPLTRAVVRTNHAFPADASVNPDVYGATNGALSFKFARPFAYTGGNLVVELRWSGNSNSGAGAENCVIDAEEAPWAGPAAGAVAYQGQGCHGAKIDARGSLAPGGQVTIGGIKLGRAAIHALGLPTSLKLDGLGAPGCVLLNDLLATSVSIPDAQGAVAPFGRTNTWPLPPDTALNGLLLHFQNVGVDPGINRLGAVTSDQARVLLGSWRPLTRAWFSLFHHNDASAPVASATAAVVPMMRFN